MDIQTFRHRLARHDDPVARPDYADLVELIDLHADDLAAGLGELGDIVESAEEMDLLLGIEGRGARRIEL